MEDINIALLIDADNVSAKYISGILGELSKYGKITIRHMYGDWSQDRLRNWLQSSASYSLTPVMQPNNTPGKNASDIGLIIDAMDILYTGEVQGFAIVSSDGDFNKLATRLREAGKTVIGMGEKKTPESFRNSCERFIFLDIIDNQDAEDEDASDEPLEAPVEKKTTKKKTTTKRKKATSTLADAKATYTTEEPEAVEEKAEPQFTEQSTIENAIVKMITDNSAEGKETGLGEIGSRLVKIFPDFDIRNYHYTKLSEYLKDFKSLAVTNRDNAVWVSLRGSSHTEIEKQIHRIFESHKTTVMNISKLKQELDDLNPNLNASIRKSGVTRFSVYLNRMIHSVEVNGSEVSLK